MRDSRRSRKDWRLRDLPAVNYMNCPLLARPAQAYSQGTNMNTEDRTKKNGKKPGCRCSQSSRCAACTDNARWERIFLEKFADPSYYNRKQVRNSSPIVDL